MNEDTHPTASHSTNASKAQTDPGESDIAFTKVTGERGFPAWTSRDEIVDFLHENMKPYHDTKSDIDRALTYTLEGPFSADGFVMLAHRKRELLGILVMLNSGMGGYIPSNILLFVGVDPKLRGQGIGGKLIRHSIAQCRGDIKLHVEYDNPAKRLYERLGFTTKYAEMRYAQPD